MSITQRRKQKGNSRTRSIRKQNKISISIGFNKKDKGYSDFLQPSLLSFLIDNMSRGKNLLQTQEDKPFVVYKKSKLHLQAVSVKTWKQHPEWNDIECKTIDENMKATPCNIGTNTKLFYKLKSNDRIAGFAVYIMALHLGIINEEKHKLFITALQKTFGKNKIRVHNEDVDWFHLKSAN